MTRRLRVAVLGGGCAGTATAFALTATPRLRERVEVTVYEQSWRLGGKGATGRDPAHGHRIEEHGLHVWMGFYDHAFAAVRACLDELGAPVGAPLRDFDDAFAPRYAFSVSDGDGAWRLQLPPRPGRPGDPGPPARPTVADLPRYARALVGSLGWDRAGRRRARSLVALATVVARGWMADVVGRRDGWDRMDALDLRAWLRRHGAGRAVTEAAVVAAFYDMAFAYPDGRSGPGRGSVAAGAALRSILRLLLTYRGAPMWLLRHGMGDTAFAPMYTVLRRRGVRFSFHHAVRRVVPTIDGGDVDTVELVGRDSAEDEPLVDVGGLPCWPRRPRGELGAPRSVVLRRGDDFDVVVLAIPIGALAPVLAPVATHHPAIARMLADARTVGTKAAQVWCDRRPPDFGVRTSTPGPFATAADLSEVLASERWPGDAHPHGLVYLVDTVPDDAELDLAADVTAWCREVAPSRLGFAPRLVAPPYVRDNREGWERYVLTPPGSTASRVRPDATGLGNLRFAGDWTKTSIDGGSVEAAFESAATAAASIGS